MAHPLRSTMTIAYYIASPTWGGGEQYVFDLARSMRRTYGVNLVFIFPPDSDKNMQERFGEWGVCTLFRYGGKGSRFSLWAAWRLAQLLEKYQVDILHLNSRRSYFQAVMAKRFCARPFRLIAAQHLVRRAKNTPLWRWMYRGIDTLICTSHCVHRAYLSPWRENVPFRDIRIIHNSVPFERAIASKRSDKGVPTIFYHGRVCTEKGVFPMIKALEQLQDVPFRCVIAGTVAPEDLDHWNDILSHSPVRDRIECLGFRTDIAELTAKYDIGIIPTIAPEAGGPLALLENMACAMPTVTSDNGSQVEFIRHGENGLLCPPGDVDALAAALRMLLTDRPLAQRMGLQAQKDFFAFHAYDKFLDKMYKLYSE